MEKLSTWRPALAGYIASVRDQPHRYGVLDCALFTAGCIKAMTGTDLARGFRGYRTEAAGLAKLRAKGFADHVELAAARLTEIAVAQALPGDIAAVPVEDGRIATGVVQGRFIYVMTPQRLGLVQLSRAVRMFRA